MHYYGLPKNRPINLHDYYYYYFYVIICGGFEKKVGGLPPNGSVK